MKPVSLLPLRLVPFERNPTGEQDAWVMSLISIWNWLGHCCSGHNRDIPDNYYTLHTHAHGDTHTHTHTQETLRQPICRMAWHKTRFKFFCDGHITHRHAGWWPTAWVCGLLGAALCSLIAVICLVCSDSQSREYTRIHAHAYARTHTKHTVNWIKQSLHSNSQSHRRPLWGWKRDVDMMRCGRLDDIKNNCLKSLKRFTHTNLKNSQSVGVSQSLCGRHVGPAVSSVKVHAGYKVQLRIHPVQAPVGYI